MSNPLPLGGIREYLLTIVNAQEGLSLDYTKASFSAPVLVDGGAVSTAGTNSRNTQVEITQVNGSGVAPTGVILKYNRLNLEKLFLNRSKTFIADVQRTQLRQYLSEINLRSGASLTESDIVDAIIDISEGPITIVLQASPDSLYVFSSTPLTFQ